jgi:hypothetical protein
VVDVITFFWVADRELKPGGSQGATSGVPFCGLSDRKTRTWPSAESHWTRKSAVEGVGSNWSHGCDILIRHAGKDSVSRGCFARPFECILIHASMKFNFHHRPPYTNAVTSAIANNPDIEIKTVLLHTELSSALRNEGEALFNFFHFSRPVARGQSNSTPYNRRSRADEKMDGLMGLDGYRLFQVNRNASTVLPTRATTCVNSSQ